MTAPWRARSPRAAAAGPTLWCGGGVGGRRPWRRGRGGRCCTLGVGRGGGRVREVRAVRWPFVGGGGYGHGYCGAHDRCVAPEGGCCGAKNGFRVIRWDSATRASSVERPSGWPEKLGGRTCWDKTLRTAASWAERACKRDEARLRRRERGASVGPGNENPPSLCFLCPLRLWNADGTRPFSGFWARKGTKL